VFLDAVESVNLLVNSNGTVVLSEVGRCRLEQHCQAGSSHWPWLFTEAWDWLSEPDMAFEMAGGKFSNDEDNDRELDDASPQLSCITNSGGLESIIPMLHMDYAHQSSERNQVNWP
jgi:hypothetical protein